jgi:hypothetical protein
VGARTDPVEAGGDLHGGCSCSGGVLKARVSSLEG